MKRENIIVSWLVWEFYETPKFLLQVWNNYFVFTSNFFSLSILLRTFFSPWRRYHWKYPNIINIGEFLNTLVSNIFSRLLGALMRAVLIIIGIFSQLFVTLIGLIVFLGWFLVPIVIIFGLLFSIFF
jgi:hypothetical protein